MIENDDLDVDSVFADTPRPHPTCPECIALRRRLTRALEGGGERGIAYGTRALEEHIHERHPTRAPAT